MRWLLQQGRALWGKVAGLGWTRAAVAHKPKVIVPLTQAEPYLLSPAATQIWQQAIQQAKQANGNRLTTTFILSAMLKQSAPTSHAIQILQQWLEESGLQPAYHGTFQAYIHWYGNSSIAAQPQPAPLTAMTDYCFQTLVLAQQFAAQEYAAQAPVVIHCRHWLRALLTYKPEGVTPGASYMLTSIGLNPKSLLAQL